MKQCEKIRNIKEQLGTNASNADIQDAYNDLYGIRPSSQAVYATLGSERERNLESISGRQMLDVKKTAKNSFNNNFGKFKNAVVALKLERIIAQNNALKPHLFKTKLNYG